MKQRLLDLAARVDALSLRERALVFTAAVALVCFAGVQLVLAPAYRIQAALTEQILVQRNSMMDIDTGIAAIAQAYQVDPDAAARARLESMTQESAQIGGALLAMQHGLVSPERMAPILEAILRANGRLQLVAMRTLAPETIGAPAPAAAAPAVATTPTVHQAPAVSAAPAPGAAPPALLDAGTPADVLYRHGVEVTVRGNYLDMIDYMSALEAMPTRLFWGKAQLEVEQYPASRLTLTLYTLSLDRSWMKL
jgi:MSHA biogenesis protein MshJ